MAEWKPIKWLVLVLLFGSAGWAAWKWLTPGPGLAPPDDPRLTFPTPFRNVRPEVGYVGDAACARCHPEWADSFHHHAMGRSMGMATTKPDLEHYDAAAHNPFDAAGIHYQVELRDRAVIHKAVRLDDQGKEVVSQEAEVKYTLGSGTRGKSYLVEHDGYLFQSPISWFTQANCWDLAPGYQMNNLHFGRLIPDQCLFCHSNQANLVPGSQNHYRAPIFQGLSIGCERCHGPGELHVQRRERKEEVEGMDDTIVTLRRLEPTLRESVCQQCHLAGETTVIRRGRQLYDFRPGLPLHLFMVAFVKPEKLADNNKAVGHVQQMYSSVCLKKSKGKLGCISCHDPHHEPPEAKKVAYYRQHCLNCHKDKGCSLSLSARLEQSKEDSCIACHMTRKSSSNIAHTAVTDHRIPRVPDQGSGKSGSKTQRPGEIPLMAFLPDPVGLSAEESTRDMGIAMVRMARQHQVPGIGFPILERLDPAVRRHPDDVAALEGKGLALSLSGRLTEALAPYESALALEPEREQSLIDVASIMEQLGRLDEAIAYAKRAIAVDPWDWQLRGFLAKVHEDRRDWEEAAAAYREALRLNPLDFELRKKLVHCLVRTNALQQAEVEFERLKRFNLPDPKALERWYEDEKKR